MYLKVKHQGPIGGVYTFVKPFAVITDLDLLKQIMTKDFSFFSNRVAYFNEKDGPLSAHVMNLEDESENKHLKFYEMALKDSATDVLEKTIRYRKENPQM